MPRALDAWRRDGLGRHVRAGLGEVRTAEPSAAVWDHIASAIASPPQRGRRLGISWRTATLLSVVVLFGVALGSLTAEVQLAPLNGQAGVGDMTIGTDGLSVDELAIQPSVQPRAIDLTMPPGTVPWWRSLEQSPAARSVGLPREAYNRALWLHVAPIIRIGPATPLAALDGR
jgi:hypothetical protein